MQKRQKTAAGHRLTFMRRLLSTMSDMGEKEPDDKDAAADGARPVDAVQDADCNGHALAESAAPEQPAEPEVLISPFFQPDAAHIVPNWTMFTHVPHILPGFRPSTCILANPQVVHQASSIDEGSTLASGDQKTNFPSEYSLSEYAEHS